MLINGIDKQSQDVPKTLFVILFMALAIRVWGTWFGHPFILHPDEAWIAQKALGFLKGPGLDLNPHFFEYPSLYMYVIAALYWVAGVFLKLFGLIGSWNELYQFALNHIFYFHLLGRLATALFGTATIFVTFLTARRLFGNPVALISAWILTFAYLHFTDSHFLTVDVPSGFFVITAVYWSILALQRSST